MKPRKCAVNTICAAPNAVVPLAEYSTACPHFPPHPHILTLSHILTLTHRACRPHSGGHSHPGGEDEQCGKRGEQPSSHLTLPSLPHSLHTLSSQAAMESGFQDHIPCHTVTMACISSNAAIATGAKHNSLSSPHQPPSLTPFPPHTHTHTQQVFVRLPQDRVTW